MTDFASTSDIKINGDIDFSQFSSIDLQSTVTPRHTIDHSPIMSKVFKNNAFDVPLSNKCWCIRCDCWNVYERNRCHFSLTHATILSVILAIFTGIIIKVHTDKVSINIIKLISFPGLIWIRSLLLTILPLLSLMMLVLPSSIDNIAKIAKTSIPFFIITSLLGSIEGLLWCHIIKPGIFGLNTGNIEPRNEERERLSELDAILSIFSSFVPDNIITAMKDISVLGIISFFLTYGILLRNVTDKDRNTVLNICNGLLKATMIIISYIIWLTPFGIYSIILSNIIQTDNLFNLFKGLSMYLVTSILAHSFHILVGLPIIFAFITKSNPYKYLKKVFQSILVGFGTSSSIAALSASKQCAYKAGIKISVLNFVLPLGSAINMDGNALQYSLGMIFISQLYDINLSFGQQIIIILLSVTVSIGTSPIPNAGVIYFSILLRSVNINEPGIETAIGILILFDWLIDRIQTAVNIASDQYITKMVNDIYLRNNDISTN